jgi:hypothetical protein
MDTGEIPRTIDSHPSISVSASPSKIPTRLFPHLILFRFDANPSGRNRFFISFFNPTENAASLKK